MVVTAVLGGGVLLTMQRSIEVTPAGRAGSPQCAAAAALWPAQVAGQGRRRTAPQGRGVAAWGEPAVIARCGVLSPAPTSQECLAVSGVDWVVETLSDGRRFTTYGRDPAMEVLVPGRYAPESLLLPAFGAAAEQLPGNGRRCS